MRICFLGDSFVNGTGDDTALGWPGRLVAGLRGQGQDVTSYNLGIRRDTSADIAARWQDEVERRFRTDEPKRLLFSFGANDCASDEAGRPRVPFETSLRKTTEIQTAAKAVAPVLMVGPAPVLDDVQTDARVGRLSAAFGPLCRSIEVPYLAIFPFLATCADWRQEAAAGDGTHPNRKGYAALADFIGRWPDYATWAAPPSA